MLTPSPRSMRRRENWWLLVLFFIVASSDLSELRAAYDQIDRRIDMITVCGEFRLHFVKKGLVGKLNGAAQRVAEQFAAELPDELGASRREDVIAEPVKSIELRSVLDSG